MKNLDKRLNNLELDIQADVSFDESVCSAEFSEGCKLPVTEQD